MTRSQAGTGGRHPGSVPTLVAICWFAALEPEIGVGLKDPTSLFVCHPYWYVTCGGAKLPVQGQSGGYCLMLSSGLVFVGIWATTGTCQAASLPIERWPVPSVPVSATAVASVPWLVGFSSVSGS